MTICLAAMLAFSAIAHAADDPVMNRISFAIDDAALYHRSTRQFVGLFLRTAGIVWIVVEWIAAIYLVRGFVLLRRWFAEGAR